MLNQLKSLFGRLDGGHGLTRGAAISFTLRIAGAGFGFALNVLIARLYGATGAGLYFLALTIAGIASLLGRVGLENAVLRFIAAAASASDWARVRAISRRAILIVLLASVLTSVAFFLLAGYLASSVFAKPALYSLLRVLTFSILPIAFIVLYGAMLKALQHIRDSQLVEAVATPMFALLLTGTVGYRFGVSGAISAFVIAALMTAALGAFLWHRHSPPVTVDSPTQPPLRLLSTSASFVWVQLLNTVTDWADILILGAFWPAEAVGIYGVAKRLALTVSFILIAVNNIAAPKFAALHHQKDHAALSKVAVYSARLTLLAAGPVLLLLMLFSSFFMGIFGSGFRTGAGVLVVLALGQLVNVAVGSVGQLLAMTGHEKILRNIFLVATVLNLSGNFLLIPKFGMMGAALSSVFFVVVTNLAAAWFVRSRLKIGAHVLARVN